MPRASRRLALPSRHRVYEILERDAVGDRVSQVVDGVIIALIVVNLVAVVLDSVPDIAHRFRALFDAVEYISLAVFTLEYVARIWVAAEHAPYRHLPAIVARRKYIFSGAGIVDLVSVVPFWLVLAIPADFRAILVLRVIRFLKIARYSPAMRSLLDVLYSERRALLGCMVMFVGMTLIMASAMHLAERHVQPDKLGTIPDAMWWAVVTLGTIGYGDVIPITPLGKLIATFSILLGVVMIALPVGIIANAFSDEIHRRDFVVTWGMVARVPLFAELNALEVAEVMRLLRAQRVEPGEVIIRRGEPGHSMYFIAAGEVEIELPGRHARLGVGHFFGEVAVLKKTRRSASVVALVRTSLLVLDADDMHALMQRNAGIAKGIHDVARSRLAQDTATSGGDIILEEIEGHAESDR
jgi:voltage-gated potassium channel